jgi:ribonucleoside-diphosphate reductase alpha chain
MNGIDMNSNDRIANDILSDITIHMKYAKYVPSLNRRETWEELVTRNMDMHIKKFPQLEQEIRDNYKFVYSKKVLPSMRSMQFAGKPIEISPSRMYNCAFAPINDYRVFSEIMFLLLGGTGMGYSVQIHHVEQLPEIRKPAVGKTRRFLIGDSIEGWSDSILVLMKAYFFGGSKPLFDFRDIRQKGARLVTSGGKAPGPQPLKECLMKIEGILESKKNGDKLTPLECHDIVCYIADAVLAGGIRRAALLCLFSATDTEMLGCKAGDWWEKNPQRGRANNSVNLMRYKISKEYFMEVWERVKKSGSGEPGIYFSNDKEFGCNPCNEVSLRPFQFCNLVEINGGTIENQEDFNARAKAAAFIGTLQASYTDFHYLRPVWQRTTEKEALLGVSLTGISSGIVLKLNMKEAARAVKAENKYIASLIGINPAARLTVVKPAGTTSLVLGTSSGIHAWHNDYYIRRMRVGKNEPIYTYLSIYHPNLIEDEYFRPHDTAVISIPQRAPEGAILRTESAISLLERIRKVHNDWIKPGHVGGSNTHNVSATVSIKPEEWESVAEWMWEHRDAYNGLSVLPYSDHTYVQAPFEDCTKEKYEELLGSLVSVDLSKVVEMDDNTNLTGELACAGGACTVTTL